MIRRRHKNKARVIFTCEEVIASLKTTHYDRLWDAGFQGSLTVTMIASRDGYIELLGTPDDDQS
jgi:hypothetical protein